MKSGCNAANVLIIEDDAEMRTLLTAFLRTQGYAADCCTNARAGISALDAGPVPVSAVIADVRMKPMDGIALLTSIKGTHPLLPVVLITGDANAVERNAALAAGAADYLAKPFSLETLSGVLGKAIAAAKRR